ncbi:hypothetical protein EP7_000830 [Isosphaeraceae bacterium EP7]
MTTRILRHLALPAFALTLLLAPGYALAKDPTDGFFDVPAREGADDGKGSTAPGYLVTSLLAGGAIFALCKPARR